MSTDFQRAVQQILEAVMFENWLRFYFITEQEEGRLVIAVSEQGIARMRERCPALMSLVEELNGREISFDLSRRAVCTFVVTQLDGQSIPRNMADLVFDSSSFQLEMHLFNSWVQGHEDQLDKNFLEFSSWQRLFAEWRDSEKVREWAVSLMSACVAEPNTTTQ